MAARPSRAYNVITLAHPWLLSAIPLLFLLWLSFARLLRSRAQQETNLALLHPQTELLIELMGERSAKRTQPWLLLCGCSVLLVALAQPRWINSSELAAHQGRDMMLALDVSGSMRALDFVGSDGQAMSRLSMLKQVVAEFLAKREGDRVGIIVFGDDAYTLAPLTSDLNVLTQMLNNIDNGIAGEKTALGSAIALGVKRLAYRPSNSRTLIVFSDGSNTTGTEPLVALERAKQENVRIYTVAVGREGKVAFPRGTLDSPMFTEMRIDKSLLRHLAKATNGKFYHAEATTDFTQIFTEIDQRSTSSTTAPQMYQYRDLYQIPLTIGLALLLWQHWRSSRSVFP